MLVKRLGGHPNTHILPALEKTVSSSIRNSLVLQIWVWLVFGSWRQMSAPKLWSWTLNLDLKPKNFTGQREQGAAACDCVPVLPCWWGVCVSVIRIELIWKLLSWRNYSSFLLWMCLHTSHRLVQHIVLDFLTIFQDVIWDSFMFGLYGFNLAFCFIIQMIFCIYVHMYVCILWG